MIGPFPICRFIRERLGIVALHESTEDSTEVAFFD